MSTEYKETSEAITKGYKKPWMKELEKTSEETIWRMTPERVNK
jgi:hypothetical protein